MCELSKDQFAKMHAYDCVIEHLEVACKDPRKRERARAQVALSNFKLWYVEGENEFERRNNSKDL